MIVILVALLGPRINSTEGSGSAGNIKASPDNKKKHEASK